MFCHQTPTTYLEVACILIVTLTGALFYQSVIAALTVIAASLNASSAESARKVELVRQLCVHRKVPVALENRAQNLMANAQATTLGSSDESMLATLPPNINVRVRMALALEALRGTPLFVRCDDGFFDALVQRLVPCLAGPGDRLVTQGELVDRAYFLCSGDVTYSAAGNNPKYAIPSTTLSSGDSFCTYVLVCGGSPHNVRPVTASVTAPNTSNPAPLTLFSPLSATVNGFRGIEPPPAPATLTADGFCVLLTLSWTALNDVLQEFPVMRQLIYQNAEDSGELDFFLLPRPGQHQTTKTSIDSAPAPADCDDVDSVASLATSRRLDIDNIDDALPTPELDSLSNSSPDAALVLAPEGANDLTMPPPTAIFSALLGFFGTSTSEASSQSIGSSQSNDASSMALHSKAKEMTAKAKAKRGSVSLGGATLHHAMTGSKLIDIVYANNSQKKQANSNVILPTSTFRGVWDAFGFVFMLYFVFVVPWRICFLSNDAFLHITVWSDCLLDVFFFVDWYLRVTRFAVYADGLLVTDAQDLWARNRNLWPLELVATLPVDLFLLLLPVRGPWILYWVRMLRLVHVRRIDECVASFEPWIAKKGHVRIATQFGYLLVAAHWLCCWWFLISLQDVVGDIPVWNRLTSPSLLDMYTQSLYFCWYTMSTLGYGHLYPSTVGTTVFTLVVAFIGIYVYASVTAGVASLASSLDVTAESFHRRSDLVRRFLTRTSSLVPAAVTARVMTYFASLWQSHKGVEETTTLAELPQPLRLELCNAMHGGFLKANAMFEGIGSEALRAVAFLCQSRLFVPGDLLVSGGDAMDDIVFLQDGGSAEVLTETGQTLMKHVGPCSFGEEHFLQLSGLKPDESAPIHRYSVRALSVCDAYVIRRSALADVLASYPADRARVVSRVAAAASQASSLDSIQANLKNRDSNVKLKRMLEEAAQQQQAGVDRAWVCCMCSIVSCRCDWCKFCAHSHSNFDVC